MLEATSFAPFDDAELSGYDRPGVKISVSECVRADGVKSIRLRGVCQCASSELQDGPEIILQAAHVVVVFGQLHMPYTFPVVGDSILFEDDNHHAEGFTRGYFDVDLFTQGKLVPNSGTYFISVAFATYLSNVVTITI